MNRFASRLALSGLVGLLAGCSLLWPQKEAARETQADAAAGAWAENARILWRGPEGRQIYFTSNRRDAAAYDLYVRDADSGKTELLFQNPGDVVQWIPDVDGSVGARVRRQGDINILQVMNPATHTWRSVYKWTRAEAVAPQRVDRNSGAIHIASSVVRY
jgi:hypothetical protein